MIAQDRERSACDRVGSRKIASAQHGLARGDQANLLLICSCRREEQEVAAGAAAAVASVHGMGPSMKSL